MVSNTMSKNYDNIPEILRWIPQWCLAGPDDKGFYKAPHGCNSRGIFNIGSKKKSNWTDFETALENATIHIPCGIGFILTAEDQYTCIDLDVKNIHNYPDKIDHDGNPIEWTTPEQLARFQLIIDHFNSYTERSASGQGYHIWVKGFIGLGLKRDGVEIYSQERFIVCTGDVYLDREIENRQEMLEVLAEEICNANPEANSKLDLVEIEAIEEDIVLFHRARDADNGDKLISLSTISEKRQTYWCWPKVPLSSNMVILKKL